MIGKISTVDFSVGSRAGAKKLIIRDEFFGLLYRLDHTDVVQAGVSHYENSMVAKAQSNPLKQAWFSGTLPPLLFRAVLSACREDWRFHSSDLLPGAGPVAGKGSVVPIVLQSWLYFHPYIIVDEPAAVEKDH